VAVYTYQARTARGERITGTIEAATERAVEEALRAKGLIATLIRPDKKANHKKADAEPAKKAANPTRLKLKQRDLALFSMHLATVLKSGLPLSLGLRNSFEEGASPRVQAVAEYLLAGVESGKLLSEAMSDLPDAFPEYYVSLIKAGETVGHVDEVLMDLVSSIEWQMQIKSDVRQASTYPMILLSLLFLLTLGIAIFVMPRMVSALQRTGLKMPPSALLVVGFGQFMVEHWLQMAVTMFAAGVGARLFLDTETGKDWLDAVKLKIPLIGTLVRQVALSRFAHHLRMMVRAGVNFVTALNVVEHVVGNRVLSAAVATAREQVIAGSSLAEALKNTRQFTPLVIQMVATGEVTGSLDDTLKKVTEYYDREVPATVKRISTATEPIVYVVLGVVVLAVALTLYSPLISMLSQINTRPRF
jgi:type II secretory pathway component PulF